MRSLSMRTTRPSASSSSTYVTAVAPLGATATILRRPCASGGYTVTVAPLGARETLTPFLLSTVAPLGEVTLKSGWRLAAIGEIAVAAATAVDTEVETPLAIT